MEQNSCGADVPICMIDDDDLPGAQGGPEHTYIGMRVEKMKTLTATPGGEPSLMDGVKFGNVPDSEQGSCRE